MLHLLGLIERLPTSASGEPTRRIHWPRFRLLVEEPSRLAEEVYRWNSDFDADLFLARLLKVMQGASLPGGLYAQADATRAALGNSSTTLQELRFPLFERGVSPETYAQFGVAFAPAEAQGEQKKGMALLPYLMGASTFDFEVCDRGQLEFESTADIRGVGVVVRPPLNVGPLLNLESAFRTAVRISEKPERAEETVLIGSAGGSRLSIQGLAITWFAHNPEGRLDLGFEGQIQAIRLVLGGGDGDGFLQRVLAGLNVEAESSLTLGMTLLDGFTIQGSGQLAVDVSSHVDLGPVRIERLRLALAPADDRISVDAGAVLRVQLGPLRALVENVGITSTLRFVEGNLGSADIETSFKPPAGVGLSVEGGIVTGGGFLSFDPQQGQYAGALQLAVGDFLILNAVGLITTRMPDGSPGFSLLLVITRGIRSGHSARFRLHAAGGRRAARSEPDRSPAGAPRRRAHACGGRPDVPQGRCGERAAHHQRSEHVLPGPPGHVPDWTDGEDWLGDARPRSDLAGNRRRDSRQPGGARCRARGNSERRRANHPAAGQFRGRAGV